MFVFNFGIGSLEQSVKLDRLEISLNTTFSKPTTEKNFIHVYY